MLAADRSGRAPGAGRHPAAAGPRRRRSTASPAGSPCATSSSSSRSSPSSPASCGRVGASRCSTSPCRRNPVVRFGHGIYFGQVVPMIGGLLSDGAAYRYLPKSVAYLPPPAEMLAMLRAAGFADASTACCRGGITQLLTGTRSRDRARRHRRRVDERPRPQRRRPRRRLPVRPRRRRPRRPRRRRPRADRRGGRRSSPRSSTTTRSAARRARSRSARCRSCPARRAELVISRRDRRQGVPTATALGHHASTAADDLSADRRIARTRAARRRRSRSARASPSIDYLAAVAAARDAVRDGRIDEGGDRPRRSWSRPTSRSTCTPSCCGCRPRSGRATATRSTGSSAPRPELLVEVERRRRALPPAGRHRPHHRRPRRRRRSSPPSCRPAPRTRSSTES